MAPPDRAEAPVRDAATVILVRDLDAARDRYESFGFTMSPRGFHSEHMGTANHTIMLQHDYIELLAKLF